jgi:hypothetical protein
MHGLASPFPAPLARGLGSVLESQGLSANKQMLMADDAEERESAGDRSSASDD